MKKISFLTLLICAIFTTASFAQGPQIGIKGGLNFTTLSGSDFYESTVGWHAGLALAIPFTDSYTLQPEILLSAQGADYSNPALGDAEVDLLYITVPIMAKFKFAEIAFFEFGPYAGIIIDDKIDTETVDLELRDETWKDFDFGVAVGAGVDLMGGLGVGVRYNVGLANLTDDNDTVTNPYAEDGDPSNGVFQAYVAYYFGK